MSLWFRIQELVVEIALRLAKVVVASLIGAVIYLVLVGPLGATPSVQLALEAWLAGGIAVLLLETGIF